MYHAALIALLCCGQAAPEPKQSELESMAKSFVEALVAEDFDKATKDFDEKMSKSLPAAKLQEIWKTLRLQVGAFKKQTGMRTEKGQFDVVYVTCAFELGDLEARVVFTKDRKLTGLWFGPPAKDAAAKRSGTPLELKTKTGLLHGSLDMPKGNGPFPAVVLVAGSGPTDRDGNQALMKNDSLKLLGQALAAQGIAVLRYDKRGIGDSSKAMIQEKDLRFDHYVDDAAAWVEHLRTDPRFGRVGLVGHSEGAYLAMLAAKKTKADAVVSVAGIGRRAPIVLREQLAHNLSGDLKEKSDKIIDELVAGRTVAEVPTELAALFRPSVQPYLISWFQYDPIKDLETLHMPVLIVQGTTDVQISVEDARRLASAKKDAKLLILEGMAHTLKQARTPQEQKAAYYDASVPLMPGLAEEIAGFLRPILSK